MPLGCRTFKYMFGVNKTANIRILTTLLVGQTIKCEIGRV